MVWEITFYENSNKLNIAWGVNARGGGGSIAYGLSSGSTVLFQDLDVFTGENVAYIVE